MNNILLIIGSLFLVSIIVFVGIFMYKEIQYRKATTNVKLPDIDQLVREEKIAKMKERSDKYNYAGLDKKDELQEKDLKNISTEEDAHKYLKNSSRETSLAEDMVGLITEDGKLHSTTPSLIKGNIDLPEIASIKNTKEDTAAKTVLTDNKLPDIN